MKREWGISAVGSVGVLFFVVVLGFPFRAAVSFEDVPALPNRMAVIGDSMSEALFANQALKDGVSTREIMRLLGIASIRDSKKRMDAFREAYADHGQVWSAGDDLDSQVFSHLRRFEFLGQSIFSKNYAVSGSIVAELSTQVDQLLRDQDEGDYVFDYVTLIIGANDFNVESLSELPDVLAMAQEVEAQLSRILEKNPKVAILWMGLPRILKIFENTKDIVAAKILGKRYTCAELRPMVYGNFVMFHDSTNVKEQVQAQLHAYQWEAIQTMEILKEAHPQAYLKTIQAYEGFEGDYGEVLAFDCYHPSAMGQAALAEISWMHGFWGEAYGRLLNDQLALNRLEKMH